MDGHVVAIVGPTGVGKSALGLDLAREFKGEIVSVDSRLVYRYLDLGTAKPSAEEQRLVPYHLINIVDPDQPVSLAQYQEMAYDAISDIGGRGNIPFVVGGSGLYFWAVIEGWSIPRVPPNPELRCELERRAEEEGLEYLNQLLATLAPEAALRVDKRNPRRLVRAIEIAMAPTSTGTMPPRLLEHTLIIGLTCPRDVLYARLDRRIEEMLAQGWVEEVRRLLAKGYNPNLPAISSIGYRQLALYIQNRIGLEEAVREIKKETRRLVRKQYNWFRLTDRRIHWFDLEDESASIANIVAVVRDFLRGANSEVR